MKRKKLFKVEAWHPHKVLVGAPEDIFVCHLGQLGQSVARICEASGLTKGEVLYRLKKGALLEGVTPYISSYRNGNSKLAKFVIKSTKAQVYRRLASVSRRLAPINQLRD